MMQKEEIKRIMKLVQEGKLSPEDAAELIEAFDPAGEEPSAGDEAGSAEKKEAPKDPFHGVIETIEKLGKDVAQSVNWQDIAQNLKVGVQKGGEALRQAVEEAKQGKFNISFFGGIQETKEVTLPFQIADGATLRVENMSGDVKIVGNAQSTLVIARASIRGTDAEDAKAKAEAYSPMIEEGDGFVSIRQPDATAIHVDLEIHLTTRAELDLKSRNGDLMIQQVGGGVRVNGTSGDIRITDAEGVIDVNTSSGDVLIQDSNASTLTVENKSGDLRLVNVKGSFNLRTASGDIVVEKSGGRTISVEAVSGDVNVDLVEPVSGAVNIRTVQGDTTLSVPDGCDCRVTMSTLRGYVDCMVDLQDLNRGERRITGRLGEGNGTLDVSAVTGDVRLRQRIHV